MVTIEELEKEIKIERARVDKLKEKEALEIKKGELRRELFKLKNRKAIGAVGKVGKFLKRTAKIVGPAIRKQAKLIRDQELRDEAIVRRIKEKRKVKKITKKRRKKSKVPGTSSGSNIFSDLDF